MLKERSRQEDFRGARRGIGLCARKRDELVREIDCSMIAANGGAAGVGRGKNRACGRTGNPSQKRANACGIHLLARNSGNQTRLRSEGYVDSIECRIEAVALAGQAILIHGDDASFLRAARNGRDIEARVSQKDLFARSVCRQNVRRSRGKGRQAFEQAYSRRNAVARAQLPAGIHGSSLRRVLAQPARRR